MPQRSFIPAAACLLAVISVTAIRTFADAPASTARTTSPEAQKPEKPKKVNQKAKTLSAEQKSAALEFAKQHHPQLAPLIRKLEKRDAAEYEKALADISKTCERLARLQSRDAKRHKVGLELWKTDSRIRLLAAQMAGDERSSQEKQLRSLLNERTDLRLQQLALERERLTGRIERIDRQVGQLSSEREELIDKEVDRLRQSVRKRTTKVSRKRSGTTKASNQKDGKPKPKPVAKKPIAPAA